MSTMEKTTLLFEKHPVSKKQARFDDSGHSAWLYVTNPNSPLVTADCWIYNRITAPQESEIRKYRTSSPPAVASYAHPHAEFTPLQSDIFEFKWSHDGRSVAVLINGIPFGFIPPGVQRGYSKHLMKTGPWGHKWDEKLYQVLFDESGWSESISTFYYRSAFSVQRSAFSVQRSAFSVQRSAENFKTSFSSVKQNIKIFCINLRINPFALALSER